MKCSSVWMLLAVFLFFPVGLCIAEGDVAQVPRSPIIAAGSAQGSPTGELKITVTAAESAETKWQRDVVMPKLPQLLSDKRLEKFYSGGYLDPVKRTLAQANVSQVNPASFVFQAYNLILQHTVLENVEMPLIYSGIDKKVRNERSLETLRQVGLELKFSRRPTELSGGEAQRVAIARALALKPAIVLADEPTGNLDSETSEEILNLFEELNQQGTTIVLITHSKDIAAYAHRIILMKDGRIVSDSKSDPNFMDDLD